MKSKKEEDTNQVSLNHSIQFTRVKVNRKSIVCELMSFFSKRAVGEYLSIWKSV